MAASPPPEGAAITACKAQPCGLRGVRVLAALSATTGCAMALSCSQGAPRRLPHWGGGFHVVAGKMRRRRRMPRHDLERFPGSHGRKEVGLPDLDHASTPVQLSMLCGGMHGGGIRVQGQDSARACIGRHHGDDPGTGTEIEDALPGHDLPLLDERLTLIAELADRGRAPELCIAIGHQWSGGSHLATLRLESPVTRKDPGLQCRGAWRL